jgi:hypothetical protein
MTGATTVNVPLGVVFLDCHPPRFGDPRDGGVESSRAAVHESHRAPIQLAGVKVHWLVDSFNSPAEAESGESFIRAFS